MNRNSVQYDVVFYYADSGTGVTHEDIPPRFLQAYIINEFVGDSNITGCQIRRVESEPQETYNRAAVLRMMSTPDHAP